MGLVAQVPAVADPAPAVGALHGVEQGSLDVGADRHPTDRFLTRIDSTQSGNGEMATLDDILYILRDALQLGERISDFTASTPLFGSVPELDSMAVVTVITAIEDRFGFIVEDDEISAETFATVDSLARFVNEKLAE